jgi:nucleotide-binding universal stress UspA family protein
MTPARGAMRLLDSTNDGGGTKPVIVVGLDGSPTSWNAFAWAAGEAARTDGRLIVLFVAPVVEPGAEFGMAAASLEARHEMVEQLRVEAEKRARDLGTQMTFVRELGGAARVLTRLSRSVNADLIVVGKSSKMLHHVAGSLGRRLVSRRDGPAIVVVP